MTKAQIHLATDQTIAALSWALQRLAEDLGDPFQMAPDALRQACLGPSAPCRGVLAQSGSDTVGAALLSPVFSTTYGTTGVYISDLWVATEARGTGLGKALLAAAAAFGREAWQASFLKLTVYTENTNAARFYDRLGFETAQRDRSCLLSGPAYTSLLEEAPQ